MKLTSIRRALTGLMAGAVAIGLLAAPAATADAPQAVQAVAAQAAAPTNIALTAVPTASYTPSWNSVNAVNNGSGVNSGGALSAVWGTWDGTRPSSHWLQYNWDNDVIISSSKIMFWTDTTAPGGGENVAEPSSWKAQYLAADGVTWVDMPGTPTYGIARTGTNESIFTPVTTKAIRATFQAYQKTGGGNYSAISVSEWEIWGEPAPTGPVDPDPTDDPYAFDEVHLRTTPTVIPTLPTMVSATYADGVRNNAVPVTWAAVTAANVATANTNVTITGTVANSALKPTATIWVRTAPSATIDSFEDAGAITVVGTAPQLPPTVTAVYTDGSKSSNVAVTWATIAPAKYAAEGFFEVQGTVAGTTIKPSAYVIVDAKTGTGDTEAPVVTLDASPAANGTGWVTGPVTVTLTADDNADDTPAIEIKVGDGAWTAYTAPVLISAQGSHTVQARATDEANNVSAVKDSTFKIDSISPVTVPTVTDNGATVKISFAATDSGSGFSRTQYSVGDGFWATYSGEFVVNKLAFTQAVEFASTDVAGNEETHQNFVIPVAPAAELASSTTTLSLSATSVANSGSVNATVTVTSTKPVGNVEVEIHDDGVVVGTGTLAGGTATISLSGLSAGVHKLNAHYPGTADVKASISGAKNLSVYFPDYAPGTPFYDDVVWLAGSGITTGYDDGSFRANAAVDRQSMAAFLYRVANPGVAAPACTVKPFTDVALTNRFCGEISWLKTKNVLDGFADGSFRGTNPVQRQATASFLYRLAHNGALAPTCTSKPFSDVPVTSSFCGAISWLADNDVVNGFADGSFRPGAATDRQTMAAFLHRYSDME